MIKPNDLEKMELEDADFEKLEEDIDNSIKSFHGWYPWEEAIIRGEYPVSVRNAIGKKYKDNKTNWYNSNIKAIQLMEKYPECKFVPVIQLHLNKLEEVERNSNNQHNKDFEEEISYDL